MINMDIVFLATIYLLLTLSFLSIHDLRFILIQLPQIALLNALLNDGL